jgi:hypothetical protein
MLNDSKNAEVLEFIDLDAALTAYAAHQTITIQLKNNEGAVLPQAFDVEIHQREQRKLINKYQRMLTTPTDTVAQVEVLIDFYELGIALTKYIVGWAGFTGTFNRDKIKQWLELSGERAEAFGRDFKVILGKYEEDILKQQEHDVKN